MAKRFHVSRSIAAPPEVVWRLLTDSESYADWNPAVVSLEGDIRAGNTIDLVSIVNPKRTFSLSVTQFDAPARMVWSDGMPLGLFRGDRTYTIVPTEDGCTFTMTEEYSGVLAGLITRAIPDMSDSFEQFANGLKTAAEAAAD